MHVLASPYPPVVRFRYKLPLLLGINMSVKVNKFIEPCGCPRPSVHGGDAPAPLRAGVTVKMIICHHIYFFFIWMCWQNGYRINRWILNLEWELNNRLGQCKFLVYYLLMIVYCFVKLLLKLLSTWNLHLTYFAAKSGQLIYLHK